MSLHIRETFINATEGHIFGESPVIDSGCESPGGVFRAAQSEYGRCTGRIYLDTDTGPKQGGWVFESVQRYEDTNERYKREVWVELHEQAPTVTEHPLLREVA